MPGSSRKFHTKSRNGCLPCRAIRKKCDEAKPTCKRCQARQKPCRWVSNGFTPSGGSETAGLTAITLFPGVGPRDRRALDYFVQRTSKQLIGTWGASRWTPAIVQCAVSEPSIQRMSIALGAIQSVHDFGAGDQKQALAHYVTALSMVRASIHTLVAKKDVLLLACTLFCAFECMNYHLDSATFTDLT